jgi:hypothetical protein
MLRVGRPNFAVACPGGTGTLDMTRRCLEFGIIPASLASLVGA